MCGVAPALCSCSLDPPSQALDTPRHMVAATCALTVLGLLLAWSVWRIFRPRPSFPDHPVVFFLLVCGALLVLRLPQIKLNAELIPDESQMLAKGMRLLSHLVPCRGVDIGLSPEAGFNRLKP